MRTSRARPSLLPVWNVGRGKQASRHFVRFNTRQVILALGSINKGAINKGEAVKVEMENETKHIDYSG